MKLWKILLALVTPLVVLAVVCALIFYFNPLWVNDLIIRAHLRSQNVQSNYVAVDGYNIHYFEALPPARLRVLGDGPPLVLIHGLGARGEDWSSMIPSLAEAGFHVYAPDLIGYGRSSKPDLDYSISLEEKTVVDFMHAVHVDKADVGGWSMGGWIAMKLTLDHPDLVKRLVIYDSAGIYFPATFDASLFTPSDPAGIAKLGAMLTPHPRPIPAFAARAAIRRLGESGWIIRRSVAAMEHGRDLLDFRLHGITKPTLIVWGGDDELIPPSVGESIHQKIAGSSMLTIEGCGHLAPAECYRPVAAGTIMFLQAYPPPKGWEWSLPGDGPR
jgi:pimeloyl-ACP methyl ester carboxylesterase